MAARIRCIFLGILLGMVLTASAVFADSCPYCGQEYGDPMPGDEARVYEVRRKHEATCSMRASDPGGVGGGSVDDSWVIQKQQQLWEEQERRRLDRESIRQERAAEDARKAAETERRKLEWERKKAELTGALKGAASSDLQLKSAAGGEVVELKPRGTEFFGLPLKQHDNDAVIQTQELNPTRQEASGSQFENLRRSFWLYQKAGQAARVGDEEEAHFLASQADEAAQGHELRVEVPPLEDAHAVGQGVPSFEEQHVLTARELFSGVMQDTMKLKAVSEQRSSLKDQQVILKNKMAALKQQVEAAKESPPPVPVSLAEVPQEAPQLETLPQKTQGTPHAEKKKGGEDLLAELRALEKEIDETEKKVDDLANEETKAQQALDKSQENLDNFFTKNLH